MAKSNALIVEVVGDTTKLKASLTNAQGQVNTFASSFASPGVKALAFGFALNIASRNMQDLGGNAAKLGNALNSLSTGNLVGFAQALKSVDDANPEQIGKDLVKFGSAAEATKVANEASAAGFDTLAKAATAAAKQIAAVEVAQRKQIAFAAIAGGTFGITPLDPLLGTGKQGAGRTGVTGSQRNQWFDAGIARELDKVQDVRAIKDQVSALKQIGAEIEKRIAATKDVTRKLTLEDELRAVRRQQHGLEDQIAADAAARAKAIKLAAQKDANTVKNAARTIKSAFAAAAATLKEGAGENGPITATTGLNNGKILEGLGLSRTEERALRARLSGFNSAGRALAASPGLSLSISLDGRQVEHSVTKNQQKRTRANPPRRRGGI